MNHSISVNYWSSRVDGKGAFLIDRCPVYFEALLNYLRQGALILNEKVDAQGNSHYFVLLCTIFSSCYNAHVLPIDQS